jgi:hypothetical protein
MLMNKKLHVRQFATEILLYPHKLITRGTDSDILNIMLSLRDLLILGLRNSPDLRAQLPKVRRLTLLETIQCIVPEEEVLKIVLYSVKTSPYLSEEQFRDVVIKILHSESFTDCAMPELPNEMAAMTLDGEWDKLLAISKFARDENITSEIPERSKEVKFLCFLAMVVEMFACSRKIANLEYPRRRLLGEMIHSASTVDELMDVALNSLEISEIFDTNQRQQVASHLMECRFDLLLKPEYFDCEEMARNQVDGPPSTGGFSDTSTTEFGGGGEDHECVICLSKKTQAEQTLLSCNHGFCTECINAWTLLSRTCPTCRQPLLSGIESQLNERVLDLGVLERYL